MRVPSTCSGLSPPPPPTRPRVGHVGLWPDTVASWREGALNKVPTSLRASRAPRNWDRRFPTWPVRRERGRLPRVERSALQQPDIIAHLMSGTPGKVRRLSDEQSHVEVEPQFIRSARASVHGDMHHARRGHKSPPSPATRRNHTALDVGSGSPKYVIPQASAQASTMDRPRPPSPSTTDWGVRL
jgi:hypothetical protein